MNERVPAATSEGVIHGPYFRMPPEMVDLYQTRYAEGMNNEISLERFMADRESEWQCDQHSEAVEAARLAGRIDQRQALHLVETVLRPYWVGHRRAGE
jgi:hypothetical protein